VRTALDDSGAIAGRVVSAGRDHRVGNASAGDRPAAGARRLSYLSRQPQSGSATSRLGRRWRIGGAMPAAPSDAFPVWRARHARSNGRRPRPCRRWRCAIDQRQSESTGAGRGRHPCDKACARGRWQPCPQAVRARRRRFDNGAWISC